MKRMGRLGRVFYLLVLGVLVLLAVLAGAAGWWPYTIISLILAGLFMATGPFVLGKGWKAPERPPTRRPVVRRRR